MMAIKASRRRPRGVVAIIALIFLSIFAALGVAIFSFSTSNVAQAENLRQAAEARLAAESGLSFLSYEMRNCGANGSLRGQTLLDSVANKLGTLMNGKSNLAGRTISYNRSTITIPSIGFDTGKSFSGQITLSAYDTLKLTVTGQCVTGSGTSATTMRRAISINFHPTWEPSLGFGLCSQGPVEFGMNTDLSGVVYISDGSIYSAASGVAVSCGSGKISGDISLSATGASTALGSTTLGGAINYNAPPVTMPTIDRTPYKNLATNVVDSKTNFSSGTFKNIRIKANTNPNFGNVTIQGVMYIESPNYVNFTNNVNFTGVMVADDPAAGSTDAQNYIYFKNNMTFNGPEQLPDTSDFAAVRQMLGASILCPGFTMEFKNNMTSVGGIMAVKALTAINNLNSTIYGSLLIYGPVGLDFKNNSDLNIQLFGAAPPPGFQGHGLPPLQPDPSTYTEQ